MTRFTPHSDDPNPKQEHAPDIPPSYHALLLAAVSEFAKKGFEGASIESIAREGGYNKSLIYRYFESKEGLFREALRHKLDERLKLLRTAPRDLADSIFFFFQETLRDRDYLRMLLGEAAHQDGAPVVDEPWRREYYRRHTGLIEQAQKRGNLPADIDPAFLMILISAIVVYPIVMPQMVRLLTGLDPDSPAFLDGWQQVAQVFAARMKSPEAEQEMMPGLAANSIPGPPG